MTNSTLKNKFLIIGCGRFGSYIANKYHSQGKNVVVIDRHAENFTRLNDNFMGYKCTGDATDLSFLKNAYIESAQEIIIVTGNDNTNLLLAYIARRIFDVPNIFIRLEDPSYEILLKGLKAKAIYPLELSNDEFIRIKGGNK